LWRWRNLLLSALGVDDDAVIGDYVLSNESVGPRQEWAQMNDPDELAQMLRTPRWLLHCSPHVMEAFLATLRARHGSIENCLLQIGVEEEALHLIRNRLVESDPPT